MSQYNNIFISREDFLDYKTKGIPYTGFVIGEGYAFVQYQDYYEDTDGTVIDMNDNILPYQICIPNIVQIQCIDTSKEMIKKSLRGLFSKNGCARYVVCEGDTLVYIAEMFDVTVEELKRWNDLSSEYSISTGQRLLIIDITERRIIDIPRQVYHGEIKELRGLAAFEMDINSPSSNILGEGLRLFTKFFYDGINAPVIWITGHTLGGFSQTPQERAQAFMDFAPTAFIGGALRILGPCSKINSGLNGYNAYVKSSMYKQNLYKPKGQGWQKEAGKMFQQAKQRFKMSEEGVSFIDMIETFNFWNDTSEEHFNWYKTSTDTLNNKNNK